ncbi:MAG: hypothetical protein WBA48_00800 [Xanthobacteraceae bacterium]
MWRRAAIALMLATISFGMGSGATVAQEPGVGNLKEMFARLKGCWRAPRLPNGSTGMEITVLVAFTRDGRILGHPRITFETRDASDDERLIYRTAVMETLQRCVPMPFIHGMGDAIAGRPFTLRFDDRRNHLKPNEKRAWLTTTTL